MLDAPLIGPINGFRVNRTGAGAVWAGVPSLAEARRLNTGLVRSSRRSHPTGFHLPRISGRSAFLQLLVDEGVTHLFGNPGTTELPIMEVVPDFPQLKFVLGLQESVVLGMADGFCRASRPAGRRQRARGAGPGQRDGRALQRQVLRLAGDPHRGPAGAGPWAARAAALRPAGADRAAAGEVGGRGDARRGPAAHPAPRREDRAHAADRARCSSACPATCSTRSRARHGAPGARRCGSTRPSDDDARPARRRCFAVHDGRRSSPATSSRAHDAFAEAAELAELLGAAVFGDRSPTRRTFPTEHPAFMGALTRQQKQVRALLEPYDLLVCLGADLLRMSVYSPVEPLPEGLPVIHVSERGWELGKNYRTDLAVQANVKETLRALLPLCVRSDLRPRRSIARLAELKQRNWSAQRDKAACGRDARRGDDADRSAVPDAALHRGAAERRGRGRGGADVSTASLPRFLPLRDTAASTASRAAASASRCRAPSASASRCRGGRWRRSSATAARCTASRRCGPRRT